MAERHEDQQGKYFLRARLIDSKIARSLGIESVVPVILPAMQDGPVLTAGAIVPGIGIEFGQVRSGQQDREAYVAKNYDGLRVVLEPLGSLKYTRTINSPIDEQSDLFTAERLRILTIEASCTEDDRDVHLNNMGDAGRLTRGDIVIARRRLTKGGKNEGLVPICGVSIHDRDPYDSMYSFRRDEDGAFQFFLPR